MLPFSRRALATILFTLLAMTASLTVAAAPASAAYSPQVICNRHTGHRGDAVGCVIHHFPHHQHGTVQVTARFWVHKKHHHHRVLSHRKTVTLAGFKTSRHGGRIIAFSIPQHIQKGHHRFHVTVGSVRSGVTILVV